MSLFNRVREAIRDGYTVKQQASALYQVRKPDGVAYRVSPGYAGKLTCSCPAPNRVYCKHIALVELHCRQSKRSRSAWIKSNIDADFPPQGQSSPIFPLIPVSATQEHRMKPEFIITKRGYNGQEKNFVLYAGLLDQATETGLKSIITNIAQVPHDDNEQTAIVQATVVMAGPEGERVFTGIGDASPRNVNPGMVTCLLRLAETRAKARALRDAINVSMCSMEELGQDESDKSEWSDRSDPPNGRSTAVANVRQRGAASAAKVREATSGARGLAAVINTTGAQCPECHAPAGAAHTARCSQAATRAA